MVAEKSGTFRSSSLRYCLKKAFGTELGRKAGQGLETNGLWGIRKMVAASCFDSRLVAKSLRAEATGSAHTGRPPHGSGHILKPSFLFPFLVFIFGFYCFFVKVSAWFLFVSIFKLMPLFLAPMIVSKDKILIFEFSF